LVRGEREINAKFLSQNCRSRSWQKQRKTTAITPELESSGDAITVVLTVMLKMRHSVEFAAVVAVNVSTEPSPVAGSADCSPNRVLWKVGRTNMNDENSPFDREQT
jgi:hypothetical protein